MLEALSIRRATPADAAAISQLTTALAQRWIVPDCSPEGAEHLRTSFATDPTAQRLAGDYVYYLAEDAGDVVGIAAIRPPAHLYHLFVADRMQRQGLARALWNAARRDFFATHAFAPVTVNASRVAVQVYERLGFVAQGAERVHNGVPSTPMLWSGPSVL